MSGCSELFDRVQSFMNAGEHGTVTPAQLTEFERLLREEKEARRLYVELVKMSVCLPRALAATAVGQDDEDQIAAAGGGLPVNATIAGDDALGHYALPQFACPPLCSDAPIAGLLGDAYRGTLAFFSGGFPLAYLLATVFMGMALGVFSLIPVHHHKQFTRTFSDSPAPPAVEQQLPPEQRTQAVARVTGLVDCRWERKGLGIRDWGLDKGSGAANPPSTIHHPKSPVRLGDRISLASGLLQLTYDTGAKVILQGPCTYEVDSPAGGFLSLGKLTARVERGEGRGEREGTKAEGGRRRAEKAANPKSQISKSQISNPQSPIPNPSLSTTHYPLFTIKTPTATVTDLGTEFGVEVSKQGETTSHVFRGSVRVQAVAMDGEAEGDTQVLHENESVRVAISHDGQKPSAIAILRNEANAERFVRQMPQGPLAGRKHLPMQVLAWYRLGEDDPGAVAGATVAAKTINHMGYYHLLPRTRPKYSANAAPGGSSLSVSFQGANDECLVASHVPYVIGEEFVLEAWACVKKIENHFQFIAYNGDPNADGYGLIVGDGRWQFLLGGVTTVDSGVSCEVGKWTHVALVCEREGVRLWLNGQPVGEPARHRPNTPNTSFSIGCDHTTNPLFSFNGEIDEVRLSRLLGPFRPEMLLFTSDKPPNSGERR